MERLDALSWGSQALSQYADVFPNNIRAMVLDGNEPHFLSAPQYGLSETMNSKPVMLPSFFSLANKWMHQQWPSLRSEFSDGPAQTKLHRYMVKIQSNSFAISSRKSRKSRSTNLSAIIPRQLAERKLRHRTFSLGPRAGARYLQLNSF